MKERYKIINIQRADHNKYGEISIVKANPFLIMGSCELFTTDESDETKTFVVSNDFADDTLLNIARSKQPWCPNMMDFTEERVYDQNNRKHVSMYIDNSLLQSSIKMVFPIKQLYTESELDQGIECKEEWVFARDNVKTPHGIISFRGVAFINDIELGLQFLTNGIIQLNKISSSLGIENIKMLRLIKMRDDNIASIQLFNSNQKLIVSFSGGDSSFDRYVVEMKKYYKM
ncbi:MAG: hypothetical protein IKQ70_12750 [Bacteroidales bacterium]|nr:hypothetical protein [Bacteroidales bacterium]